MSSCGSGFSEVNSLRDRISSKGDPQFVSCLCGRRLNSIVAVETFLFDRECGRPEKQRSPLVDMIPEMFPLSFFFSEIPATQDPSDGRVRWKTLSQQLCVCREGQSRDWTKRSSYYLVVWEGLRRALSYGEIAASGPVWLDGEILLLLS